MTYLLDVDVLVALSLRAHQHHRAATEWIAGVELFATTPLTEGAFVRILSSGRLTAEPISITDAVRAIRVMWDRPGHRFLEDDATFTRPSIDLSAMVGPKQVPDFHLVNLVARRGHRLATFDGSLERALAPEDRRHVLVIPG